MSTVYHSYCEDPEFSIGGFHSQVSIQIQTYTEEIDRRGKQFNGLLSNIERQIQYTSYCRPNDFACTNSRGTLIRKRDACYQSKTLLQSSKNKFIGMNQKLTSVNDCRAADQFMNEFHTKMTTFAKGLDYSYRVMKALHINPQVSPYFIGIIEKYK